jgi:hypothetical protein
MSKIMCVFCGLPVKKSESHKLSGFDVKVQQSGTKKLLNFHVAMIAHTECMEK